MLAHFGNLGYDRNMNSHSGPALIAANESEHHHAAIRQNIAGTYDRVYGIQHYHALPSDEPSADRSQNSAFRTFGRARRLVESMKTWGALPQSAVLGTSMLTDMKSGVHFPEVTWRRDSNVCIRHWLRMSPPLKEQDEPPAMIRFVTGTCLFGRGGAVANLTDGSRRSLDSIRMSLSSPINKLSIRRELSLYELDTACRLSSVIRDMAQASTQPAVVYVHVPRPEYVLVMLGHQRGARSGSVMRAWLDAVEHRGMLVGDLFHALIAVGSAFIKVGSPFDAILMPYLREALTHDRTPSVHELIDVILSSHTAVGELLTFWLAARDGTHDIDYYDLAYFGYVAGVAINLADTALTIEVDNPSEQPIFQAVSRTLRHAETGIWRGNVMAVYPCEHASGVGVHSMIARGITTDTVNADLAMSIMKRYGIDQAQRDEALGVLMNT